MKTQKRQLIIILIALLGFGWTGFLKADEIPPGSAKTDEIPTSGTYTLNGTVTLTHTVTLTDDLTINVAGTGAHTIIKNFDGDMFVTGAHNLTITGTSSAKITLDGGGIFTTPGDGSSTINTPRKGNLIKCGNGNLTVDYVIFQNIAHTSSANVDESSAVRLVSDKNLSPAPQCKVSNSKITSIQTYYGAAMLVDNNDWHDVEYKNVEVSYCKTIGKGTFYSWGGAGSVVTIDGCHIHHNYAGDGAAIYWNGAAKADAKAIFKGNTIIEDNVNNNWGTVFNEAKLDILSATIRNNTAKYGGGVMVQGYNGNQLAFDGSGFEMVIGEGVTICNNTATFIGGGVYVNLREVNDVGFQQRLSDPNDPDSPRYYDRIPSTSYKFELDGGLIYGNEAPLGAGVAIEDHSPNYTMSHTSTVCPDPIQSNPISKSVNVKRGKIYGNTTIAFPESGVPAYYTGYGIRGAGIFFVRHYPTKQGYSNLYFDYTDAGEVNVNLSGGEVFQNDVQGGNGGGFNIYNNYESSFNSVCNVNVSGAFELYGNTSSGTGAGIYLDGGNFNMTGGTIGKDGTSLVPGSSPAQYKSNSNTATGDGGGFYVTSTTTTPSRVAISGGTISYNVSSGNGGGFYVNASGSTPSYINSASANTLISNNRAVNGAGVYFAGGNLDIYSDAGHTLSIIDNVATAAGGGVYYNGGTLQMKGTTLSIHYNKQNLIPNNVYLPTGKVITVNGSFTPDYVGIYTQSDATTVEVFTGDKDYLGPIYTGMQNGTVNIYDDRQIYSAKYTANDTQLFFDKSNPWSTLQQTVTKTADLDAILHGDVYEISNVKQLTAFLCYVNGISPNSTSFGSGVASAKGKLVADINMEGHYWVPIANYTGTFDGNGYTITNLTMVPSNPSTNRGMFDVNTSGTIENVILRGCYFGSKASASATNYMGGIAAKNDGSARNNVVDGTLYASNIYCIIGGIAGQNSGTVHSSFASPSLEGYQMGGLVGENTGNLYNSFANASFNYKGSSKYFGGLVGVNTGRVENCYVRVHGTMPSNTYFGYLAGNNTTTANKGLYYSYSTNSQYVATVAGTTTGNQTGLGTYTATSLPYLYGHADNQVSGTSKSLLVTLNNWVNNNGPTIYTFWLRPWQKDNASKIINDDLPLLRMPATNAVAATAGDAYLDYNQVNDLLGAYNTASDAVLLYGSEGSMDGNASSSAILYIDKKAVLKQSGTGGAISAYVSAELENLNPAHYQWHMFSTALQNVPLGVNYTNNNEYTFSWGHPSGMPYWRFYAESDANHGYFPSMTYAYGSANAYNGSNADATSYGNYYYDWDYYAYYEPHYHWINFKRNSNSHWHEDDNGATKIPYTNETYLGVGKGYFLSVKEDTYLQAHGTLNNGTLGSGTTNIYKVTVTDDIAWSNREGFNLVGNPYQSYLDFDAFATANKDLWNSDPTKAYYYVINGNAYTKYVYSASENPLTAPRLIHPHQGFFIVADNADAAGTALVFNDDMRNVTGTGVTFRGSEQPAYPLVNLIVTDDEDKSDIATVELGRPDKGGAKIMADMRVGKGIVYCHYEDEDYAIAFTQPGISEANIRFETAEDAPFTMTWDTENGDFQYLHLIDNLTGTDIDCLAIDEYKFTAKTTDYKSRFRLVFGYTGIDEPEVPEPVEGPTSFAFMMGDELVVNGEGKLQLLDMSGRLLMETQVEGTQSTFGLPELAPGLYLLRLGSQTNGTRTQKIIIR